MTIPPEPLALSTWRCDPAPSDTSAPVRPLRRFAIREAPGFGMELDDAPEAVYLLGQPDGSAVVVPQRVCGRWDPTAMPARRFFYAWEPDGALDVVTVQHTTAVIGRLCFPSGWQAGPWFANPSRVMCRRQVFDHASALLGRSLVRWWTNAHYTASGHRSPTTPRPSGDDAERAGYLP